VALTAMPLASLVGSSADRWVGHHHLLGQRSDPQHPEREYFDAVIQDDKERQAGLRKGQVVDWKINGHTTRALVEDIYVTKGNHQLSLLIWPVGGAQIITERNLQNFVDVDNVAALTEDEARQAAEALERWTHAHQRPSSAQPPAPSPPPPRQSQRAPKRALAPPRPAPSPRPRKQPRHPSARVTKIEELPPSPTRSHPTPSPPPVAPPLPPPPPQLPQPQPLLPAAAAPSSTAAAPPASWPPPLAALAAPLAQAPWPLPSPAPAPTPMLSLAPTLPSGGLGIVGATALVPILQGQQLHQAVGAAAQAQLDFEQQEVARLHHNLHAERLAGLQQRLQQAASAQELGLLLSRLLPG
jgi:hypothetical protein